MAAVLAGPHKAESTPRKGHDSKKGAKIVLTAEQKLQRQTKQIGNIIRDAIRSKRSLGGKAMKNIEGAFKAIDKDLQDPRLWWLRGGPLHTGGQATAASPRRGVARRPTSPRTVERGRDGGRSGVGRGRGREAQEAQEAQSRQDHRPVRQNFRKLHS
jgi:hypothetical protein